jgi:hypothetical protein
VERPRLLACFSLDAAFQVLLFFEGSFFGCDEVIAGAGGGADEFVEFEHESARLATGGVLDEKHHDESEHAGDSDQNGHPALGEAGS